jgi:opacity protein-like surface antigen
MATKREQLDMRRLLCVAALATALPIAAQATENVDPVQAGDTAILSDAELDNHRGGQRITLNDADLSAEMEGNTLVAGTNGSNSIGAGALSGVSGIATVVQNTGNQVIIQSSTILNVTLE